jgi:hypothetical protein
VDQEKVIYAALFEGSSSAQGERCRLDEVILDAFV